MTLPAEKTGKRKIRCKAYALISDENGRIWPCCHVCTTNPMHSSFLKDLEEKDPHWNDIKQRSLKEILEHDAYTKHFNKEHFEDHEKVDIICYVTCGQQPIRKKIVKKI